MSNLLFACLHNPHSRQAASILREHGHTVVGVDDGLEAWKVIEQNPEPPTLIFAHLLLPYFDGAELFGKFRERFPAAPTRLMLGTHMEGGGEPPRNWNVFVHSYVMRPYSAWQLVLSEEQLLYRTNEKADPDAVSVDSSPFLKVV